MKRIVEKIGRVIISGLIVLAPILFTLLDAHPVFAVTRTLYWVGGNDTWNVTAGAKWSLASGGAGGEGVPDSDDNVIFDGNSGVVTVQVAPGTACLNLSCTGGTGDYAGSFTGTGVINIYGSLTLSAGMLTGFLADITFHATTAGHTITTNGKTIGSVVFQNPGGEWTLQDNLTASQISMVNGSLITNNNNIATAAFLVDGDALDLGTSIVSGVVEWGIYGGTITANNATINMSGTPLYFQGGGVVYGDVSITGVGTGFVLGGLNTFANLTIVGDDAVGDSLIITDDQIITVLLTLTGYDSDTKKLRIESDNPLVTQRQISTNSAIITNCDISDIFAAGVFAAPYWDLSALGLHDADYGNNTNILFPSSAIPIIMTGIATNITQTTATLQGSLISLGSYPPDYLFFEYDTTGLYGADTISTPEITTIVTTGYSKVITGLTAGNTYHYRAVARYVSGGIDSFVYGASVTFSYTTIEILEGNTKAFRGYLETGDLLICVEYINNQAPYAPSEDPKIYFAMQLLSIDGTTILASTPLPHWGNKVTSIYLSAASSSNITDGGAYIIRMMGLYTSPASVSYTLTASDWRGSNMNRLDDWVIGAAWSINAYYGLTGEDMIVTSVPGKPQCITEKSEGIFTSGIPYIKQKRPGIFQSTGISTTLFGGTPNLAFDESKSWEEEVGPLVAGDMDDMGNIFGITGRNFNGLLVAGIGMMAVGALLSSGIAIFSGILIMALVGITGAQFRAIDIQWLLVPVVIFCLIFVAGYFWDRS